MIIPWQDIAPETLENLIREFVLREGTDYGTVEISLQSGSSKNSIRKRRSGYRVL